MICITVRNCLTTHQNPILETINDNPECFNGQNVTHKDFNNLVDKLAKYHNRGGVE